jgi:hypothetical protein
MNPFQAPSQKPSPEIAMNARASKDIYSVRVSKHFSPHSAKQVTALKHELSFESLIAFLAQNVKNNWMIEIKEIAKEAKARVPA